MAKYYILTEYLIPGAPVNGNHTGEGEIGIAYDLVSTTGAADLQEINIEEYSDEDLEEEFDGLDDEDDDTLIETPLSVAEKLAMYKDAGLKLPEESTLCTLADGTTLGISYYNVDEGRFMITAPTRQAAYRMAETVRGYFTLFHGWTHLPEKTVYSLLEMVKKPQNTWDTDTFLESLSPVNTGYSQVDMHHLADLTAMKTVGKNQFRTLVPFVEKVYASEALLAAVNGLHDSRSIMNGFMLTENYIRHYVEERRSVSRAELEKMFCEYRFLLSTSFFAATRGIAMLLGEKRLTAGESVRMLEMADIPGVKPKGWYKRHFEQFCGYPQKVKYADILDHFARTGRSLKDDAVDPKKPFAQDSVFEAQLLLGELIARQTGFMESYRQLFYV